MRNTWFFAGMAVSAAMSYAATCGGHGTRDTMLVTSQWLAAHLNDPNLVVIGIGQKAEYDAAHIPGSQFLDYNTIVLKPAPERPNSYELPPMADLAAAFGNLGVSNDSHIVLYMTKDAVSPTTRVYLTLDAMGLGAQASLLDGGFPEWQRENRPVTTDVRPPKTAKLQPCAQSDVVADVNLVKSSLNQSGVRVVDARTKNFYTGETPGRNMRPGHIPGRQPPLLVGGRRCRQVPDRRTNRPPLPGCRGEEGRSRRVVLPHRAAGDRRVLRRAADWLRRPHVRRLLRRMEPPHRPPGGEVERPSGSPCRRSRRHSAVAP